MFKQSTAEAQSTFTYDFNVPPHEEATLEGHTGFVIALTVLPSGRLASGSDDNTIKLWDVEGRRCEATLEGHTDYVRALTVLPSGRLASGSKDNTIKLWDVEGRRCEATLKGHTSDVRALTVLPSGRLASGSFDETIKLWDVDGRRCEATLEGHTHYVVALTVLPSGRLASGSYDKTIKLWDVDGRRCEATLEGHTDWVRALTVLPSGRLASGSWDTTIKLWDVDGRRCEATLEGHTGGVRALTVLPSGRLASGSLDKTIKLWDVEGRRCEATLAGHTYPVGALTVLPSGRLASGSDDNTIKLWDVGLRPVQKQLLAATQAQSQKAGEAARVDKGGKLPGNIAQKANTPQKDDQNRAQREEEKGAAERLKEEQAQREPEEMNRLKAELEKERERVAAFEKAARDQEAERRAKEAKSSPEASTNSSKKMTSADTDDTDGFDVGKGLESLFIAEKDVALGRELGRGGFGIVYEGTYAFEPVAVKTYYGTRLPVKEAREMRHEIDMMRQLQSRFLVRLLGLVNEPNSPAMLVMEYGANGSLYNFLHSERDITWGLRLRLAEELAHGLGHLHQKKIVHRDIKSLNIVLDEHFHAKWCDFGLATLKLHSTTTSKMGGQSAGGTLRWMAPELLNDDEPTFGTKSDIWALGMVFFELASREIPYKNLREQQVMFKISQGKSETVPEECQRNTPEFGALMQRCWKERSERPTAAEIVTEMTRLNGSFVERPMSAKKAAAASVDSGYMDFSRR